MTDAADAPALSATGVGRPPAGAGTDGSVGGTDRWRLLDEQDFLRRSLDDAEQEHDAGDLADDDYALLRRRDERRLGEVEAALSALDALGAELDPPPAPAVSAAEEGAGSGGLLEEADGPGPGRKSSSPGAVRPVGRPGPAAQPARRRPRRWLAAGGVVLLVAGAIVLVVELASPRLPGQAPTGSIDLSTAQKEARLLQEAQADVNGGRNAQALELYGQVLDLNPKTAVALAEWGWIEWQAATAAKKANAAADGEAAVTKAVQLQPSLYAAQYYLGTMQLRAGQVAGAVDHYQAFLDDHPTSTWVDDAAPNIRKAYAAAGQPLPAGIPPSPRAGSGSTSAPTPTSGAG